MYVTQSHDRGITLALIMTFLASVVFPTIAVAASGAEYNRMQSKTSELSIVYGQDSSKEEIPLTILSYAPSKYTPQYTPSTPKTCGEGTIRVTQALMDTAIASADASLIVRRHGAVLCFVEDVTAHLRDSGRNFFQETAITIGASSVTVDLNGYTLTVVGASESNNFDGFAIYNQTHSDLHVRDGYIVGVDGGQRELYGVISGTLLGSLLGGSVPPTHRTAVTHVYLQNFNIGIGGSYGSGFQVKDNVIELTTEPGSYSFNNYGGIEVNTVQDALIQNNQIFCGRPLVFQAGILTSSDGTTIEGNFVTDCWSGIYVVWANNVLINGNTVMNDRPFSSGISGLVTIYESQNVRVTMNAFSSAIYGIHAQGLTGALSEYSDNTFCRVDYPFATNRIGNVLPMILVRNNRDICGGPPPLEFYPIGVTP